MTQVKFFYNQENQDLFAVFVTDFFKSMFGENLFGCYSFGHHSSCSSEYIKESREARDEEYIPLLNEMIQNGYKELEII